MFARDVWAHQAVPSHATDGGGIDDRASRGRNVIQLCTKTVPPLGLVNDKSRPDDGRFLGRCRCRTLPHTSRMRTNLHSSGVDAHDELPVFIRRVGQKGIGGDHTCQIGRSVQFPMVSNGLLDPRVDIGALPDVDGGGGDLLLGAVGRRDHSSGSLFQSLAVDVGQR